MKVLRWGAAAALAAVVCAAPSFADDDLSAMKASMNDMKTEMEAMRSQLEAEREELRMNAGGAPEGLTSAKGNATIRIGGDVRVQYGMTWANGWNRQHYQDWNANPGGQADGDHTNVRSFHSGWDISRAKLTFDMDLSCDTKANLSLRFDERGSFGNLANILDNAYWQWNNVGGSGFGLTIGLMDIPFGMWANTDMGGYAFSSVNRPLITYPFVRRAATDSWHGGNPNFWLSDMDVVNLTNLALMSSYNWDDQVVLKAGIMASAWETEAKGIDSRLTYANENRNIGFVDHFVTLGWNPCWVEGLHLEVAYMGRFDEGRGVDLPQEGNPYANDYNTQIRSGDHAYKPAFDLGVNYKINDKWRAWGEGVLTWNPYWGDGVSYAMSVGVDYTISDRIMVGAGFDYFHANYGAEYYANDRPVWGDGALYENLYRLSLGARYDFGNGLYLQAQYYHDLGYVSGVGDQDVKDADSLLFQTGFVF